MKLFHSFKTHKVKMPEERRTESSTKLKHLGVACMEALPVLPSAQEVTLKSVDTICRRAIACLLSTQLACDIAERADYEESRTLFFKLLKSFGVETKLLPKEKKLFDNDYTDQDAMDVAWTYECYWSLVWALGLIDEIEIPDDICDCGKAITLVENCQSFEEFRSHCHPRSVEEILDMLDLYYCYHWACVEKNIKPETPIGVLQPDVVVERRRGLEWLISPEHDWNEITMST